MEWLWTGLWFVLSWAIWLLYKILIWIFWSIFGLPLLIIIAIAGFLWWRVGFTETLRRLKEMRHAVVPALRAFAIAMLSLISTMTGVSVLDKLPERLRRMLVGGGTSVQIQKETVVQRVTVVKYRCGPIARLFNIGVMAYGIMQLILAVLFVGSIASMFL